MRYAVSSFGSAGDFLPTLALAAALRRRGHAVHFVANPFYESRVRSAGLELIPAGEYYNLFERFEQNPRYADVSHAGALLHDLVAPNVAATYFVLRDLLRTSPIDALIVNDVGFGALWAAQENGVPSVLVHASPMIWMSWRAPIVVGDRLLPSFLSPPATIAARAVMNWYMTRFLRPLARLVGSPLTNVSYPATEGMAALRLALWSPLLRGPISSDPSNGKICGFTHSSDFGGPLPGLPQAVDEFLAAGAPPVVVGLGSAFALLAGDVLMNIADACAAGGHRCLIIGHPSGARFPEQTLAVPYAPYDQVFPRAAAVVVHGGAGTTGEALRGGKPIIGVPFAYDQFGQCQAIERIGVGVRVGRRRRSRGDFVELLRRVLSDDALRRRAAESGQRFAAERDGAEVGADWVERLCSGQQAQPVLHQVHAGR